MDFSFPPGVSIGATKFEREGRWYDCDLIRWRDGRMLPIGGWSKMTASPIGIDGIFKKLFWTRSNTDNKRLIIASDNNLHVFSGATVTDITPSGFVGLGAASGLPTGFGIGGYGLEAYGTPRAVGDVSYRRASTVSLDGWGEDVMFLASTDGRVFRWTPGSPTTAATLISAAPAGRAMCVTPERHMMIVGAGGNPRRVAWSDRENYNIWTSTSTNLAGYLDLESDGLLTGLAEVRDGTLVFSDSDVWIMRFGGGEFVYGRERVGNSTSLISPNAVATFAGRAAWMGEKSFWIYDGGQVSPLPCDIASYVFDDEVNKIDPVYGALYVHASHHGSEQEIWWHYPANGSKKCNRYIIYNYAERWWAIGKSISRSAMTAAGVNQLPIMAGYDGYIYQHEDGHLDSSSTRVGKVFAESGYISSPGQVLITRGQMDSGHGYDATKATIFANQTKEQTEKVFGPYTGTPSGYMPMRAGGKNIRIRVEATKDQSWAIGKFSIDAKQIGDGSR